MKLSQLLPTMAGPERDAFAQRAGTSAAYLWQLATRWRGKKPSIDLLRKLAEADARLTIPELVQEFADVGEVTAAVCASVEGPSSLEVREFHGGDAVQTRALDIEEGA